MGADEEKTREDREKLVIGAAARRSERESRRERELKTARQQTYSLQLPLPLVTEYVPTKQASLMQFDSLVVPAPSDLSDGQLMGR